jgi:hypothetical protein
VSTAGIQIANFVLAGALVIAATVGIRRALPAERTWGPLLLAAHGAGLAAAGVFVADPGAGFPAGAPTGPPTSVSWHAALHGLALLVAMLSIVAACVVFARRFARDGSAGWALYSGATAVAVPAILALGPGEFSIRAVLVTGMIFAWIGVLSLHLRCVGGVDASESR